MCGKVNRPSHVNVNYLRVDGLNATTANLSTAMSDMNKKQVRAEQVEYIVIVVKALTTEMEIKRF